MMWKLYEVVWLWLTHAVQWNNLQRIIISLVPVCDTPAFLYILGHTGSQLILPPPRHCLQMSGCIQCVIIRLYLGHGMRTEATALFLLPLFIWSRMGQVQMKIDKNHLMKLLSPYSLIQVIKAGNSKFTRLNGTLSQLLSRISSNYSNWDYFLLSTCLLLFNAHPRWANVIEWLPQTITGQTVFEWKNQPLSFKNRKQWLHYSRKLPKKQIIPRVNSSQ